MSVASGIKRLLVGASDRTDQCYRIMWVTAPIPLLQVAHSSGRDICFCGTLPGHAVSSRLEVP